MKHVGQKSLQRIPEPFTMLLLVELSPVKITAQIFFEDQIFGSSHRPFSLPFHSVLPKIPDYFITILDISDHTLCGGDAI